MQFLNHVLWERLQDFQWWQSWAFSTLNGWNTDWDGFPDISPHSLPHSMALHWSASPRDWLSCLIQIVRPYLMGRKEGIWWVWTKTHKNKSQWNILTRLYHWGFFLFSYFFFLEEKRKVNKHYIEMNPNINSIVNAQYTVRMHGTWGPSST